MRNTICRSGVALVLSAVVAAITATEARGMGEEQFGNKPLSPANYEQWKGLLPAVNDQQRVFQQWVNGNESCYYQGDIAGLNAFLQKFAAAKLERHHVVLLPGPGEARTFDGQKVACNWRLHFVGGIAAGMARRAGKGEAIYDLVPTVYVYVGRDFDLAGLKLPANVKPLGIGDLRKRYRDGMQLQDKQTRGYAAMFLAEIDADNPASAAKIAELLEDDDRWLTAMTISCLKRFGADAQVQLARLERLKPGDPKDAQRLDDVIHAIKTAPDRAKAKEPHAAAQAGIDKVLRQHESQASPPEDR